MNENFMNKFGYAEMYEWSSMANFGIYGRFVMFDNPDNPSKITLAKGFSKVLGVTSVNATTISDDPDNWHKENLSDEFGDVYMKKVTTQYAKSTYDDKEEMQYVNVYDVEEYEPIKHPAWREYMKYKKRSSRNEWAKVCILGKCIVEDNGMTVPGEWCMAYQGNDDSKAGTAVRWNGMNEIPHYYVMSRVSEKSVMILFR